MAGGIEPSNLDKVFWPDAGFTKGDLRSYFQAVAPFILPALRDRPLTVKRYPNGIEAPFFYQKDTPAYAPRWVTTVTLHAESAKRDVRYTLCNSERTLLWLANQASIELHPWLSRSDRLDRPDHLVLDVDPPEDGFEMAVEVALAVRRALDSWSLPAIAKTSGAKGVHVYTPLLRRYDYGQVRRAAVLVAESVAEAIPDLATTEFKRAERGGKVFLDTGRVGAGAHVVAPYSPRARPKAPVSFPVTWQDLSSIDPTDFTIESVPRLLKARGDLWKNLMPPAVSLPRGLREASSPKRRSKR